MSSSLGERIKYAREQKKILQADLAQLINVKSAGVISNWEKDINKPDADKIVKLCDVLNVSVSYLLDYYGKTDFDINSSEYEHIKKYRALDDHGRETVNIILERETQRVDALKEFHEEKARQSAQIIRLEEITRPKYYISYYQRMASGGSGEYLFDDIPTDLIEVPDTPTAHKADFVIGINGQSMEPDYMDGDKVFVKKAEEIPTGSIGVFLRGNDCFIKELGIDRLISHNPNKEAYPDIPASEDMHCVGLVLGMVKE